MTSRLFMIVLLVSAAVAPAQEDKDRIANARSELKKLEVRAEKLPKPPALNRRMVPTPAPRLLDLSEDLRRFAKVNNDLDHAPAALLLQARVLEAIGDPARAVRARKQVAAHGQASAYHKVEALREAARLQSQYGDYVGALATLKELLEAHPEHSEKSSWMSLQNDVDVRAKKQKTDVEALEALRAAPSPAMQQSANGRALRFAASFPMAPYSLRTLERTLGALAEASNEQKCAASERLAHYFPQSKAWPQASRVVVEVFAREGEYEKALQHAQNLLNRSEVLKGQQATQLNALLRGLRTRLKRIYARPIDVDPKTKRKRLAHFVKFAKPWQDQAAVAELAEGLRADYPEMSELPKISWILAGTVHNDSPDQALALYREIAEKHAKSEYGFDALELATPMIEEMEGAEAAEAWLKKAAENYPEDREALRIGMKRAEILSGLDRWEEARSVLQPLVEKAAGGTKDAITTRIKELDQKIGD